MVKKPTGGKVWDGNGWNSLIDDTDAQQPWPPNSTSWKSKDTTVFIGVSSFRDRRCPKTLYNFYSKAKHPERVYVGVVQQNDADEDPDCIKGYCELMKADPKFAGEQCPFEKQIKVARVEAKHAAGNSTELHNMLLRCCIRML
jgi:Glycosyltransferase (GlcNAc)